MGQAKAKKVRFFAEHHVCILCGDADADSIDHIPPRACFPRGQHPEGHEFPTCDACNKATRGIDQIFGLYSTLMNGDDSALDRQHLRKLTRGVANNAPHLLPRLGLKANDVRRALRTHGIERPAGTSLTDLPLVSISSEFDAVAKTMGRKLARALHYKHCGAIVSAASVISVGWQQQQLPKGRGLVQAFADMLPARVVPTRPNLKNYGPRFAYAFGQNRDEDLFAFLVSFGPGLVIWGCVAPWTIPLADNLDVAAE